MAKTFLTITQERPVIKCPNPDCEMIFCVDYMIPEGETGGWSVSNHQTCRNTYCFYCGKSLTIKDELIGLEE